MTAAGDGGTAELLAWRVAMGAAGARPAETVFYVPSVPLRCGMGGVTWTMGSASGALSLTPHSNSRIG